ncbi:MAG: HD domain-containing phosphohydrolase [Actinomycetota bacterium]
MRRQRFTQARLLLVDDQPSNLYALEETLKGSGYGNLESLSNPTRTLETVIESAPDLLFLDLHMPLMDGFSVLEALNAHLSEEERFPVVMLTADPREEVKLRALGLGVRDFLTKPLNPLEVVLRADNLLETRFYQRQLVVRNRKLERDVKEGRAQLDEARLEALRMLAVAAEYRDYESSEHAQRVANTSASLAVALGLGVRDQHLLRRAAPLHDIGKIGIPDSILLKPRKLTESEFEIVQRHTTIGATILSGSEAPLALTAREIALGHHERWDGNGYPNGLHGEDIPMPARVVAVADVWDALTHERPYKPAWDADHALKVMRDEAGGQFDPRVIEALGDIQLRLDLTHATV